MRVLQLIDSLKVGGAERVAINIANELVGKIERSYLCATREEGNLKDELNVNVEYLFLKRRQIIDFKAIMRLKRFVTNHSIEIIHAHASSFFIASVIKVLLPNVKLIWHDHLGNRSKTNLKNLISLKLCSYCFSAIICVNTELKKWSQKHLNAKTIRHIPNFAIYAKPEGKTLLSGTDGKRILHLANLKKPKNHLLILRAFSELIAAFPYWTLHLVGKDYSDDYSNRVKSFIQARNLSSNVFILGQRRDISHIVSQCNIGVLTSTYEGLPLSLLEYGLGGMAAITSNVGECPNVVGEHGLVFKSNSHLELIGTLKELMSNEELRTNKAQSYKRHIIQNYGKDKVMLDVISVYNEVLKC